ncbi:MAG: iron-sulfur cluster assembly scaffold protein [Alphaproteobacteria bacterium]|nr:iron-sulfur cluster assembly scaffold protein [Alphaproteobacteria bacterium]
MDDQLYQAAIVGLARAAHGKGRLEAPDGSATVDNPLCGDRITIDVRMDGERVAAVGHQVRGCLLCEAAASVIGAHAAGATRAELTAASDTAKAMLTGADAAPPQWPELGAFAPVRAHRSRHSCVLLPFEALTKALVAAE